MHNQGAGRGVGAPASGSGRLAGWTQGVVRSSSVKVTRRSCCNHQGRVFPQAESLLGASELLTTASCRAERHSSEKQLGAVRSSDRGRNGQCIMAARWVAGGNWPSALPGSLKEWRLTRSWHLDKEMPDPSPVMAACPATCFLLTNSSSSLSLVPVFLQVVTFLLCKPLLVVDQGDGFEVHLPPPWLLLPIKAPLLAFCVASSRTETRLLVFR
ncbi:uncharacterized protein [Macaca nemestrina]|uniref:uncharacterized protein isoform X1 n=1 Tax=Macaca nemestrina TaxID=9545 RepID=UPI0039B95A1A